MSKSKGSKPKRDLYQEVTDQVLACLEGGTVPWRQPWAVGTDGHRNPVTGTAYRGVNPMLLEITAHVRGYSDRRWVTFNGAKTLGGKVRKGERGQFVVFFKRMFVADDTGSNVQDGTRGKVIPMLRHFVVFNVEQLDGAELPEVPEREPFNHVDRCEEIVADYIGRGPSLQHGGGSAHYVPATDHVQMPDPETFRGVENYYSTLFHELGHSTGHASRLDRPDLNGGHAFGSKGYAREELTAEMTAAMLCGVCEIATDTLTTEQTAPYVDHWRGKLRDDPRCVVIAAQRAQKAADLIRGISAEREETGQVAVAA